MLFLRVLAACVSKYSGGCLHYFRALHTLSNMAEAERFEACLRRYISRKIGFESVMRIRCTRGQLAEYEVSAKFFKKVKRLMLIHSSSHWVNVRRRSCDIE